MRLMSFPGHDIPAQGAAPVGHPSTWSAHQADQAAPPKRRTVPIIAGVLGVLALVVGTGVTVNLLSRTQAAAPASVAASPSAATLTASGTLLLKRGEFSWNSAADPTCQGLGGYSDLRAGTQVVVTDAAGKKLAVGALVAGRAGDFSTESDGTQRAGSCSLSFAVSGVPRGVGPYGVEVSHRGVQNYNETELDRGVMLGFN